MKAAFFCAAFALEFEPSAVITCFYNFFFFKEEGVIETYESQNLEIPISK